MNITESARTEALVISLLNDCYQPRERVGDHVTDLLWCMRKSYYNVTAPLAPPMELQLHFLRGQVLHAMLQAGAALPEVSVECDGIVGSIDELIDDAVVEYKTTNISVGKSAYELPDEWWRQIMAYCHMAGVTKARLVVLHLQGDWKKNRLPQIKAYDIEFTEAELKDNWQTMVYRHRQLWESVKNGTPPPAVATFMCEGCPYLERCASELEKTT